MKVSVTVCDVCGTVGVLADKYELKVNGARKAFDLCEEHSQPLTSFMAQFPKSRPLGRPAASSAASARNASGRRPQVVTLEEIEAEKAAKKTAPKKRAAKKVAAAT